MNDTKFTPEFIDRERKLIASVSSLPWSGAGRPPCIIGKDRQHVFMGQDGNVPGQMDNWNEIWYAQDAANNYPAALAEIERLNKQLDRYAEQIDDLADALEGVLGASGIDRAQEIAREALNAE